MSNASSMWYVIAIVIIGSPQLISHRNMLANTAKRKGPVQRKNAAPRKDLPLTVVHFLADEHRLDRTAQRKSPVQRKSPAQRKRSLPRGSTLSRGRTPPRSNISLISACRILSIVYNRVNCLFCLFTP